MPLLRAEGFEDLITIEDLAPEPLYTAQIHCYDDEQMTDLAFFKKNCDTVRLNYDSIHESYHECLGRCDEGAEWWQDPIVIGGFVSVSLLSGILIGTILK